MFQLNRRRDALLAVIAKLLLIGFACILFGMLVEFAHAFLAVEVIGHSLVLRQSGGVLFFHLMPQTGSI